MKQKKENAFVRWWKNRKKWQRILTAVSLAIILLIASIAVIAVCIIKKEFDYNYNEITEVPQELGFEEVKQDEIINIALFGVDTNKKNSFSGRSDSIIILSLNKNDKKIKLISVMRDSLVPIEKNGKVTYNKINSAYATGGPELAIKTLNQNFELDISEYATVNFEGMADIIDAVGGIDVELTKAEVKLVKDSDFAKTVTGTATYHLNGTEAVRYARIRKTATVDGVNNDHGRTDRQRHILELLFNKALTLDKSEYIPLIKALLPCTETSLSYNEILDLATGILLNSPTFEQTRIPDTTYQISTPTISGVGACVYYDLDFASKLIHSFIYEDITPETYIEQNGISKNDWYANR